MAGKRGEWSTKATKVPEKYDPRFLQTMDRRLRLPRILRQSKDALLADLGGEVSFQENVLVDRIVHLMGLVTEKEMALANGEKLDVSEYLNCINCLSGLLTKVGLKRRAKTLSLKDYLNAKPEPGPVRPSTSSNNQEDAL